MITLGLTGGIASGKSLVSRMFREMGAVVIDADQICRQVMRLGTPVWKEIVKYFGREILEKDSSINRKKLGEIVFRDPGKLRKLNDLVHPPVIELIKKKVEALQHRLGEKDVVVLDAPLLIEAGLLSLVDRLIVVDVDREIQIKRLMERSGLREEEALARISSQMPLEEKKKWADYVVDNSRNVGFTWKQVRKIWKEIRGNEKGDEPR